MASSGPSPKRHKRSPFNTEVNTTSNGGENPQQTVVTLDTLLHLLFGKKENEVIDLVKLQKKRQVEKFKTYCHVCRVDRPPNGCPFHEPSSSKTADHDDNSLSYAIKSFPPEVQLCTSSIPGAHFGVCAKRVIPEGTWIGPYEGKRLQPDDLSKNRDNSYIWEIYENGQASCYIDGSDEGESSWMRFIRCARHKEEQNLYAFQYLGNVFYRSFKDVAKGTEMLVWYDDKYPQYMGIPTGLQEIEFINALDMERSPSAEKKRKSPGAQLKQSSGDEKKYSEKQRREDSHKPRGHYVYPKVSSASAGPRSSPSGHSSISSHHSTISFRGNIEEPRRVSSHGIIETSLPINYTNPTGPLACTSLTYTPTGAYRKDYDSGSLAPVNISAGVPSQNMMGRVPTASHTGITGAHIPEVQQKVIDEGPVIVSAFGSGPLLYHHDNGGMTSGNENITANTNWIPTLEGNAPLNTSQTHPAMHGQPTPQPFPRHSNQGMKSPNIPHEPTVVSAVTTGVSIPTVTSVGNDMNTTSQEASRPRRTSGQTVSEEALRERGYPVNTSSRRSRSRRRPHSGLPIMSDYIWGEDGDDLYEKFSEDEEQTFGEAVKATESDSNSSTTSSQPKDDNTGSSIDEISMWRCRQCQKTFTQRVMLQVHVCPHEPFKPYRCGQCELSFNTAPELRIHVDTHASEKPFKCGFCSRSFAGATTLNNHIRTHMGKRPFQCECGKSFAQAGQLARHQRTPGECQHMVVKSES